MDAWGDKLIKKLLQLNQEVVYESASRIIDKTPEDSGTLKGNINVSENIPDLSFSTLNRDDSGSNTKRRAKAAVSSINNINSYITASAPYAKHVEDGSSSQAPNGFMRVTALEIDDIVNTANKKVR